MNSTGQPSYQELASENLRKDVILKHLEEENRHLRAEKRKHLEDECKKLRAENHRLNNAQYLIRTIKTEPNDSNIEDDLTPAKRLRTSQVPDHASQQMHNREITVLRDEKAKLQQEFDDSKRKVADLELKLTELNERFANSIEKVELQSKLDESMKAVNSLRSEMGLKGQRIRALEGQMSELRQSVDSKQQNLTEAIERANDLKQKLDKSKQEADELKVKLAKAYSINSDAVNLQSKFEKAGKDVALLAEDKLVLKKELTAEKQNNNNLRKALVELNGNYESALNENCELKKQPSNVISRHDETVEAFESQGKLMMTAKRFGDALDFYFKAIAVEELGRKDSKRLGIYWCAIAVCWGIGMSRYEKALEAVKNAIKFDASNAEFYYVQGIYNKLLGNQNEAVESLKQSLRLNPNYENAKNLLSRIEASLS